MISKEYLEHISKRKDNVISLGEFIKRCAKQGKVVNISEEAKEYLEIKS